MLNPSKYYCLKPPKVVDKTLLKSLYTDKGLSCSQIAWLCDTDPVYIGKQLRIYGIPLRKNGKRPQLRLRKTGRRGLCPLCGTDTPRYVEHHWWELPDYSPHAAWICRACNLLLKPSAFGIAESHVLPNFKSQRDYIQHRLYPKASQHIKTRQHATIGTTIVAFRLNDEVYAAIQEKAKRQNLSIGDYLKALVSREALRDHHKSKSIIKRSNTNDGSDWYPPCGHCGNKDCPTCNPIQQGLVDAAKGKVSKIDLNNL